jgi:hypothetical protein
MSTLISLCLMSGVESGAAAQPRNSTDSSTMVLVEEDRNSAADGHAALRSTMLVLGWKSSMLEVVEGLLVEDEVVIDGGLLIDDQLHIEDELLIEYGLVINVIVEGLSVFDGNLVVGILLIEDGHRGTLLGLRCALLELRDTALRRSASVVQHRAQARLHVPQGGEQDLNTRIHGTELIWGQIKMD